MLNEKIDYDKLTKSELYDLYEQVLQEKLELELGRVKSDRQIKKSKQRTIEVFGKMIDVKKAQRIIGWQYEELEAKNTEINLQKDAVERTFKKFRLRTIELFGKMIDLKKANKIIQQQKDEIEIQRKLLHETNASKDKFFNILGHDLKNPIAGFLGLTEIMAAKMSEFSSEKQQIFAESLHESSKQLYTLLENLLHWARSQTGSLHLTPINMDLDELLESSISQVSMNAQLKNISIRKQNNNSLKVFADEDTLHTILRNLLSNAIKFSHSDSFIDVSVSQNEKFAIISICDYGVGIAPEDINKLFKIDQTYSQLGTAEEKGTGLGLILCKEFIELNGGTINVESIINKKTIFSITVPLI
ncbi:MAG: GHKL domain-containing protein [Salinivirgaceae bacterium]|nr:GHKL domain-containing protein [Salinivirgaceae bacterium]